MSNNMVFLQVEFFFRDLAVGSGQRALAQALETIRLNIQWHEHNLEDVSQWLSRHLSKGSAEEEVTPQ